MSEHALGRDSTLLREMGPNGFRARYIKAIREGLKKRHAAAAAGCDESTPREWFCQAREDREAGRESIFTAFADDVDRARVDLAADCLQVVNDAAETDWRAARWLLELQGYRPPQRHEHAGSDGGPLVVSYVIDRQDEGAL